MRKRILPRWLSSALQMAFRRSASRVTAAPTRPWRYPLYLMTLLLLGVSMVAYLVVQ